MCAHARAILYSVVFYRAEPSPHLGLRTRSREKRGKAEKQVWQLEMATQNAWFFRSFPPCQHSTPDGMHRFIAPDSKACQLRFSKPPQRIAESAFSLLFSCFSSLTTLPLHYENETKGLPQRHREINYSSLRLADVTNFNEVRSASMFN